LEKLLQCYSEHLFHTRKTNCGTVEFFIDEISKTNNLISSDLLNHFLDKIYCWGDLALDQILILINAGANPRYNDDAAFLHSCKYNNIKVPMYFLYECGADINTADSNALIFEGRRYLLTMVLLSIVLPYYI
jgi:hypothetical protein